MRVLITGGAGFIGSHLSDLLIERGDHVTVLDNLSTGSRRNFSHLGDNPRFEFYADSILNSDLVDNLVSGADIVFHLAAAVGVELIIEKPLESLTTNLRGSEIVFEKAHKYGTKVVVTSTSEIYGKNVSDSLKEDDDRILGSPLKSRWAYSEAKAIDEFLAYTYWKTRGLPTVITRLFNTIGPRQSGHYGMVIPRFVLQALKNEPVTVYGTGEQRRCFCYVGDIVRALADLAIEPKAVGSVFNLGGSEEITIASLAERIIRLTRSSSTIKIVSYEKAYAEGFEDMQRRVPNTTRAREAVGFVPTTSLDSSLEMIIASLRMSSGDLEQL